MNPFRDDTVGDVALFVIVVLIYSSVLLFL